MKTCLLFCLLLLGTCAFAQEVLVPLDSLGKLESISPELDRKLRLFGSYANFRDARLYQLSDSAYVLEIVYQPDGRVLKERRPLSMDSATAFLRGVQAQLLRQAPRFALNQEGRARFIAGTTTLALGYYGWAIPSALNVKSAASNVAGYLLIGGSGFFLPYVLTQNTSVTDGQASLAWYGGSRGIVHGLLLDLAIRGGDAELRDALASGTVVSLGELIALYNAGKHTDISQGKVAVVGVGGDYGFFFGLGATSLGEMSTRGGAVTILISHGVGLLAGKWMNDSHPYTKGDARVLSALAWLGGGIGVAASDLLGNRTFDPFVVAAMAGSVAGLGVGHSLTRNTGFTAGQGSLIALGELGGALTGAGLAYVVKRGKGDEKAYVGLSALGGVTGFWLTYKSFAPAAGKKTASWDLRVAPEPLISASAGVRPHVVPGVHATVSF